jgi:hypothetical protein
MTHPASPDRTCEKGCNGCEDCTDYDEPASPDREPVCERASPDKGSAPPLADERARFEAWALTKFNYTNPSPIERCILSPDYRYGTVAAAWDAWQARATPAAPTAEPADEQFTVRQLIEGAWCAGYYDAGYTHDSAYACAMATKFADEALATPPAAGLVAEPPEQP